MGNVIKIVSVNIGKRETVQIGKDAVETGIFKHPSLEGIAVNQNGLTEDVIADLEHHGGADQAVYLYSLEDYAWWSAELGREIVPSTFGENITLSSFGTDQLKVGDRFQINDVLIEVTAPRIPCAKLAAKMEDPGFVKRFVQAQRPGAYGRVLQAGVVQVDEFVKFMPAPENYPTLVEVFNIWYAKERDPELLHRGLASPLAERAKGAFKHWLDQ